MPRGVYSRKYNAYCDDKRPCFAKKHRRCTILNQTYEDGQCPFAKARQEDKLSFFAETLRAKRAKGA